MNWQLVLTALQNIVTALNSILAAIVAMPSSAPVYQFASLPAPAGLAGKIVYVSNARKVGEGPGAGTGQTGFSDGVSWFSTAGTLLAV
jgi:hypothetical protein